MIILGWRTTVSEGRSERESPRSWSVGGDGSFLIWTGTQTDPNELTESALTLAQPLALAFYSLAHASPSVVRYFLHSL